VSTLNPQHHFPSSSYYYCYYDLLHQLAAQIKTVSTFMIVWLHVGFSTVNNRSTPFQCQMLLPLTKCGFSLLCLSCVIVCMLTGYCLLLLYLVFSLTPSLYNGLQHCKDVSKMTRVRSCWIGLKSSSLTYINNCSCVDGATHVDYWCLLVTTVK